MEILLGQTVVNVLELLSKLVLDAVANSSGFL
jgi:hypothetical protein